MTTVSEFTDRARKAKRARELATDTDMGFLEMGIEIGKVLRSDPIQAGTVRRWFRDVVPSDLDTIWGMAVALNVDPGWLAFGGKCDVQPPAWFTPKPPTSDPAGDQPADGHQGRRQLAAIRKAARPHHPKRTG